MKKKIKVAYLLDNLKKKIKKYLKRSRLLIKSQEYASKIFTNFRKIKNYDIEFIIGYTEILKHSFLKINVCIT